MLLKLGYIIIIILAFLDLHKSKLYNIESLQLFLPKSLEIRRFTLGHTFLLTSHFFVHITLYYLLLSLSKSSSLLALNANLWTFLSLLYI